MVGKIAGLEALDTVDFDMTLKRGLEGFGFPQDAIREDKDVEEIRKARQQAQAQQQQRAEAMEQQKQIMGNYNKLNEPVKQGSALEDLKNQMGEMAQ